MGRADRYYELLEQIESARSQGRYQSALALCLEAVHCLPAVVQWCVREFGRWDIPSVPPIAYACRYLAAQQRRDELQRLRAFIATMPELSEWLEEIDGAFGEADLMGRVGNHLREHPGALQKDMGRELGVDGREVANLLLYARQIGVVRREAEGRTYRLYLQGVPAPDPEVPTAATPGQAPRGRAAPPLNRPLSVEVKIEVQPVEADPWLIPDAIPGVAPSEVPLYKRTAQIVSESVVIAGRTDDPLTKLKRLDLARQRMEDLLWLSSTYEVDRLSGGIALAEKEVTEAVQTMAIPEVEYQIGRAERTKSEKLRASALRKAGALLAYCREEAGDDPRAIDLQGRFVALGGEPVPRERPTALSATHVRVPMRVASRGGGCLVLLFVALVRLAVGIRP